MDADDVSPSVELVTQVEGFVRRIFGIVDLPVDIHPMPEGDITVNISPNGLDMVFVHCDADDSAFCMVKWKNQRTTRSYDTLAALPDVYVSNVLRILSV